MTLAVSADLLAPLRGLRPMSDLYGHTDLVPGVWLSADPDSAARFSVAPAGQAVRLSLEDGDSARWCCLAWRLPVGDWRGKARLGLTLTCRSEGFFACHLSLRHVWTTGGHEDVFADHACLYTGGVQSRSCTVELRDGKLSGVSRLEPTLFFQCDRFSADLISAEIAPV